MSKVLFLSVPSHGHVNPTLGLVNELVQKGEEVVYFSSVQFKEKIEQAGATFKSYIEDLNIFKMPEAEGADDPMVRVIQSAEKIIDDILHQTEGIQFDYIVYSTPFPFAKPIAQILNIPTASSLGIFAGLGAFFAGNDNDEMAIFPGMEEMTKLYRQVAGTINEKYGVTMPGKVMDLLLNKGDINLVYTSEYFISPSDRAFFDNSFKFVGPPVYKRKENLDFPFGELIYRKVIYISLGTVFGNFRPELYDLFFKAFGDMDAVVVMAAHNLNTQGLSIPDNFIVRDYVPQNELLKFANVAITHAGMNSISDLLNSEVPFVCIPLGADQPDLARRAEELGATISLDADTLTVEQLKDSVEKVLREPAYLKNIQKIRTSFEEAGGYEKAVQEIFRLKKEKGV